MRLKFLFFTGCLFLLFSCKETPKPTIEVTPPPVTAPSISSTRVPIGKTGLSIDLPADFEIKNLSGDSFTVYLFQPLDTSINKSGGGIYFGFTPDQRAPASALQKKDSTGTFLGKPSNITQYTTPKYIWTETVIDQGDAKIQTWYYGFKPEELSALRRMMNSIGQ